MAEFLSLLTCLEIRDTEKSTDPVGVFHVPPATPDLFSAYFELRAVLKELTVQGVLIGPDGQHSEASAEHLVLPVDYLQGALEIVPPPGASGPHEVELLLNGVTMATRPIRFGPKP